MVTVSRKNERSALMIDKELKKKTVLMDSVYNRPSAETVFLEDGVVLCLSGQGQIDDRDIEDF